MLERSLKAEEVGYKLIEFSSHKALRSCLRQGLGITLCPAIAASGDLARQSLISLATTDLPTNTPVVMIWHIDKWCSPLLQQLIELTEEIIGDKPSTPGESIHLEP